MSSEIDFLAGRIAEVQHYLGLLNGKPAGEAKELTRLLSDTLHELDVAMQTMQTVEEELRRQNEDLVAALGNVESERYRYQALFDFAPDCYLVTDMMGTIQEANHAAATLLNVHREYLGGKPLQVFLPEGERRTFRARLIELSASIELHEWEMRLRPRHGENVEVLAHVAIDYSWRGERIGLRWLLRDMTQRKQAEKEIREWYSQFDERVEERTEHLRAENTAKDRFLAILSHELRTPLTALLGAVYALEMYDDLPPEIIQLLGIIHRNAIIESRLIDDLLDLTRIARGKLMLNLEIVDAHRLVEATLEMCREEIAQTEIRIALHLDAGRRHVLADPARLQQVLWNLIKNAIKFTPRGGTITISTTLGESEDLSIEVRDTGIGIDSELLPKIFNAFEQGEQDVTRRYGGLGLGLAISKALLDMQDGRISAASDGPMCGATFTIELPIVASNSADAGDGRPEGAERIDHDRSILLVEDHIDTSRVVSLLLEQKGYHVETVHSLSSALEAASRQRFDLVISDIGLPDGSGLDVIRTIHTMMPVKGIALSGYGMEEDIRRSREAGFSEHLVKPISSQKLLNVVERLITVVSS